MIKNIFYIYLFLKIFVFIILTVYMHCYVFMQVLIESRGLRHPGVGDTEGCESVHMGPEN